MLNPLAMNIDHGFSKDEVPQFWSEIEPVICICDSSH